MAKAIEPVDVLTERFFSLLGKCIAAWAGIDDELYLITRTILSLDAEKAGVVYFRSPSIDVRITLTSDLVKTVYKRNENNGKLPATFLRWKALEKGIRDRLAERNHMAHSSVEARWSGGDYNYLAAAFRIESRSSDFDQFRGKGRRRALLVSDLEKHLEAVTASEIGLRDFRFGTLRKSVPHYPTG